MFHWEADPNCFQKLFQNFLDGETFLFGFSTIYMKKRKEGIFYMKRMIAVFCLVCLLASLCACGARKPKGPLYDPDFHFSLVWGCYGISSYDSRTGKLVKTTDATDPEEYVTTFYLTKEEMETIGEWLVSLDPESYPDEYDPHLTENGETALSSPSMTLILTVEMNGESKTIACRETALQYTSRVEKGNAFLQTCKKIVDMLTSSEAWKALPEYEFLYD